MHKGYWQQGAGADLVLLHGFCEHAVMWAEVLPLLASRYTVHTFDLPGFGSMAHEDVLSMEDAAAYVHRILEQNAVRTYVVAGHSMGGYVGLCMMQMFPESVLGLSLVNSHADADSIEKAANRSKTIEFLGKNGREEFLELFVRDLLSAENDTRADWITELLDMVRATPVERIIQGLEMMRDRRGFLPYLSTCDRPVQFLIGKADKLYKYPELFVQASKCRHADVHLFDSGHLGVKEKPEQYVRALSDFVKYCYDFESGSASPISVSLTSFNS
ncbi:MAG: alpha/beta hydrolase [Flavobacteriales bacterium]|nr:alpha/beta hydrolase [Flavobacteriales bacterium]